MGSDAPWEALTAHVAMHPGPIAVGLALGAVGQYLNVSVYKGKPIGCYRGRSRTMQHDLKCD